MSTTRPTPIFAWSATLATGLPSIDAEHRRLFALVDTLAEACTASPLPSSDVLEGLLAELTDYARTHFRGEEALMAASGLHPVFFAQHCEEHAAFAAEVTRLSAPLAMTGDISHSLLRYLMEWLVRHISRTDVKMSRQITLIEQGKSPEEALRLAGEPEDASKVVLFPAMDALFRLLFEGKRELEARVAERTSELVRTRDEWAASEKMTALGEVAAALAHEVNNPLTVATVNLGALEHSVRGVLALAEKLLPSRAVLAAEAEAKRVGEGEGPKELDSVRMDLPELFEESRAALERIRSIVSSLRIFASGDTEVPTRVNLRRCIEAAVEVLPKATLGSAQLTLELGPSSFVMGHAASLSHVLLGLLCNACEAVATKPTAGRIWVGSGLDGAWAWVEVADDGIGMIPEVKAHIFEPFFTTRRPGRSLGLGLSVAYGVIARQGGRIEVDSERGVGARFRVYLPAALP
jgi:hemerythrin-like metal-binding protein